MAADHRRVRDLLPDLLLPSVCGGCGAPGPSPCVDCWRRLAPAPLAPPPAGLDDCVALLRYQGPARELVVRLKYRNQRAALSWLADGMADLLSPLGPHDAVTWAPTTPARRRSRGFDQAELLARAVGRRLGRPATATLLRLSGPPQTGRSAIERRAGGPTFVAVRHPVPAGDAIVVVDDVITSGSTLAAAARALRVTGWERVVGAVAARTPARR